MWIVRPQQIEGVLFEKKMKNVIRIGSGAAWWGDRVEPAALNAEKGELDYLCFETMAEATVSAAQVRARRDPSFPGYDTYLDDRMRAVLPACMARGTKIISNQGWINPDAAAQRVVCSAHYPSDVAFGAACGVAAAAVCLGVSRPAGGVAGGVAGLPMAGGRPPC